MVSIFPQKAILYTGIENLAFFTVYILTVQSAKDKVGTVSSSLAATIYYLSISNKMRELPDATPGHKNLHLHFLKWVLERGSS